MTTQRWCDVTVISLPFHSSSGTHCHGDVIKWKYFPRYWPFVRGIHRSTVNSPHEGKWRSALMFFFFIWAWINGGINNSEAGDLRCHRAHYDVSVMIGVVKIDKTWNCVSSYHENRIQFQSPYLIISLVGIEKRSSIRLDLFQVDRGNCLILYSPVCVNSTHSHRYPMAYNSKSTSYLIHVHWT